jgi:hypothetical protein
MRATAGQLRPGSTLRVQIESRHRGVELVGDVTAGDRTVSVAITENGRERVKRTYSATRLTDADLLMRAVEELTPDPLALDTLRMARRIVGADRMQSSAASIREPTR